MKSQHQTVLAVLQALSSKEYCSGETLAKKIQVSRTTIFNAVQLLKTWGVDIYAVSGKGYLLAKPYEWLSKEKIITMLPPVVQNWIETIDLFPIIHSTNTHLLEMSPPQNHNKIHLCLAETQSSGRGRSEKYWLTPFGRSIACSLMFISSLEPKDLTALPLVIAITMAQTLKKLSFPTIAIKWPNDLWFQEAKLGGILIETKPLPLKSTHKKTVVIIGVGINEQLTQSEHQLFQYPVTDLQTIAKLNHNTPPIISKNALIAKFLEELYHALHIFERQGFQPFLKLWTQYDALQDKTICVHITNQDFLIGKAQGVTQHGLLKVFSNNVEHWIHHAHVTIETT